MRRPAPLSELASELGTTERTLNRRFKQAVGKAPLRYWQSVRIKTAKTLLERGDLSVDAVTAQIGYEDVSTFRQLFRRETGLSPTEYRRHFARASGAPQRPPFAR
jgi:transcriptional regulator GlxA family with amidase domain